MQINPLGTLSTQTLPNDQGKVGNSSTARSLPNSADALSAVSGTEPASKLKSPISEEALRQATESIREFVKASSRDLNFTIDKDTDQLVVKVIDASSNEVIRQMPSEEVLAIAKALDKLQGLFVQQKV